LNLEQSLEIELSSIAGLNDKVYPLTSPQGAVVPYLIYTLSSTSRDKELTGNNGLVEAQYEFNIYHTVYASLKSIIALMIAKIKTFNQSTLATTGVYIQEVDIINEFETYENEAKLYKGIIEVNFYYQEN
jgi:hypothetical protein